MTISEGMIERLLARAKGAKKLAYAPYSSYPVGAALLGDSGEIYPGVNVENAAYSSTMCAERSAIFSAVSAPPGAVALHTSPKPPRPRNSTKR